MKKFWFSSMLLLLSFIIVPFVASAASIGNPDTLGGPGKVSVGVEYDSTNQPIKITNGDISISGGYNVIERFGAHHANLRSQTGYVTVTVGILPKLDAFAGIGVAHGKLGFDTDYSGGGSDTMVIKNNMDFAWKVGLRAQFLEVAGIKIGGVAQHSAYSMEGGKFSINGKDLGSMASYKTETAVQDWQAALTASTRAGMLNPYAGAIYRKTLVRTHTDAHFPAGLESSAYDIAFSARGKQAHIADVVIGTGFEIAKNFGANVEYQPFNKEASGSLSYRF